MTDREKAIKTLEDIINIYERHKRQGSITRALVLDTEIVESLKFALESIKVDRAYDLAYEKVDFIEIPEGATNGYMIKAMFNIADSNVYEGASTTYVYTRTGVVRGGEQDVVMLDRDWWNSPYRKEQE